jgi:hypothetical protein
MKKIGRLMTFSNVVACLALFIALGGASYAAFKLPKNSVGTKQLKKGAVTAVKVKPGSLLAKDFRAGQLPAGAVGPKGAAGLEGAVGPPGLAGTSGELSSTPLPHARVAQLNTSEPVGTGRQEVTFDTMVEDNAGMVDLTAHPATLQVPVSGLYFVAGDLLWSAIKGAGRFGGLIQGTKNAAGSEYFHFRSVETFARAEAPLNYLAQPMSEVIRLKVGQYVALVAYQETGETNHLLGEGEGTWLEATYLGP